MSVQTELLKLRHKMGWTQEQAAKLAEVSKFTWNRAEGSTKPGRNVTLPSRKTLRQMMESLLSCADPISAEDAYALADAAGISRSAVRPPVGASPAASVTGTLTADTACRLVTLAFQLAISVGESRAEAILRQIVEVPLATPIPSSSDPRASAAKQYLRVVDPPLQRPDGSIEEVSRGYEVAPPTLPAAAPVRRSTPGKN